MHRANTLLLGALLALTQSAGAQVADDAVDAEPPEDRRYTVEIILFRYGAGVPAGNEIFLPDPPPEPEPFLLPDGAGGPDDSGLVPSYGDLRELPAAEPDDRALDSATEAAEPEIDPESIELEEIVLPTSRVALEVLPREALTLTDVYEKLELLDAYEPVLWAGWTQAAVDRDLSPAIPLRRLGNAPPEFDGMLTLYLSRFLHLVVDLTLTPRQPRGVGGPEPTFGDPRSSVGRFDGDVFYSPDAGTVRLRIEEDRIVRNGDLRYFDHPRFGMLAKVTRVEEAEAPPVDDTDVLAPAPVEPRESP